MQSGQELIKAIGWREWGDAKKIIEKDTTGEVVRFVDNEGRNPLHRACSRGAPPDLMKVLLSYSDEDTLMLRDKNGLTPLHWAVSSSSDETVITMVMEACPRAATVTDKAGRTPYDLAKGRKKSAVLIERLQDAGMIDEFQEKANAALVSGNISEAIEYYTKCLDKFGPSRLWYSNRSAAYLLGGDANKALEDAELCLECDVNFADGYARKASALHACGRYREAIDTFEQGLEIFPDDIDLQCGLTQSQEAADSEEDDCCQVQDGEDEKDATFECEIEELRDEIDQLKVDHSMAIEQVKSEAEEASKNYVSEIEDLKQELEQVSANYLAEIEDIKRDAEEALQLQESEAMVEIEALRNEVTVLRESNDELQEVSLKAEELRESQNKGSATEIDTLTAEIDNLRAQLEEVESAKDAAEKKLDEQEKTNSMQISKLRIDLEVLGEEKDLLSMELTEAQSQIYSNEERQKSRGDEVTAILEQAKEARRVQELIVTALEKYGDAMVTSVGAERKQASPGATTSSENSYRRRATPPPAIDVCDSFDKEDVCHKIEETPEQCDWNDAQAPTCQTDTVEASCEVSPSDGIIETNDEPENGLSNENTEQLSSPCAPMKSPVKLSVNSMNDNLGNDVENIPGTENVTTAPASDVLQKPPVKLSMSNSSMHKQAKASIGKPVPKGRSRFRDPSPSNHSAGKSFRAESPMALRARTPVFRKKS